MNDIKNEFTQGPILPPLIKFALPILAALFLQAMYGAADLIIVGRFDNAAGVSSVGTGSAVMMIVTMLISGLAMGATVIIGRHIGEQLPEKAGETVGTSVILFSIVAAVLTGIMLIFSRPLAAFMQAPAEAFDKTVQYVRICSSGIIFIVAYNVISGIFRGLGNSRLPMYFVAIACIVNIAGDLLLVAVFRLGPSGAAIATISAQAISVIISLIIISRQKLPFSFTKSSVRFNAAEAKNIMKIGAPIALQDSLVHISFLLINAIINGIGLMESAGYGIAERVTGFIFLIPSAIMSAVSTFVAQNIGAGQPERARRVMFTAMSVGTTLGLAMFAAGFFGGKGLSLIFSSDTAVAESSADYLRGFSADCLLTCILFAFVGYFNGCGKTIYVMLQGITSSFLVRFPLSYLFSLSENTTLCRIGLAAPLATVYGIIFFIICYRIYNKERL